MPPGPIPIGCELVWKEGYTEVMGYPAPPSYDENYAWIISSDWLIAFSGLYLNTDY